MRPAEIAFANTPGMGLTKFEYAVIHITASLAAAEHKAQREDLRYNKDSFFEGRSISDIVELSCEYALEICKQIDHGE